MKPRRWNDAGSPRPPRRFSGVVKEFNDKGGYGVITPDNGAEDLYVNASQIRTQAGPPTLAPGQRCTFEVHTTAQGRYVAGNVEPGGYRMPGRR